MSELMRFRVARAPQKHAVNSSVGVSLYIPTTPVQTELAEMKEALSHRKAASGQEQVDPVDTIVKELLSNPTTFVPGFKKNGFTVLDKLSASSTPMGTLERWLTSVGNRTDVVSLDAKLREIINLFGEMKGSKRPKRAGGDEAKRPKDGQKKNAAAEITLSGNAQLLIELPQANWWNERRNVGLSLIVAMVQDKEPSRAMYFNRLMLVFGLIELAARTPANLREQDAILRALRWRAVLLPRPYVEFIQRGSHWLTSWGHGGT